MQIRIERDKVPYERRVEALQTVKMASVGLWMFVVLLLGLDVWSSRTRGHVSAVGVAMTVIVLLVAVAVTCLIGIGARSIRNARPQEPGGDGPDPS